MNAKKMKTMVISKREDSPEIKIKIDGTVHGFNYLGHKIRDDGRCAELPLLEQPNTSANKIKNSEMSCLVNITWTICNQMKDCLNGFEMWTYRRMLRVA